MARSELGHCLRKAVLQEPFRGGDVQHDVGRGPVFPALRLQKVESDIRRLQVIGARPIARFIGVAERRVYRIAEDKELPLFKFRGQIAGRKSRIREAILRLEANAEGM